jgi:hypothetical protein
MAQEYTKLFNTILKQGKISEEWRKSTTIPIFKKGANYRRKTD